MDFQSDCDSAKIAIHKTKPECSTNSIKCEIYESDIFVKKLNFTV